MITQNLWDAAKAVLLGKFIAVQHYLEKQGKTSNRQPDFTTKTTKKSRTPPKCKISRRKEIIKMQAEINEK